VDPYGAIEAVPARALMFGNRGVLHGPDGRLRRQRSAERRWIVCRLEFNGRHQQLNRPGRYTGLFFLDEATALAAGHRPCFECRRADFTAFLAAFGARRAAEVDAELHLQRGHIPPLRQPWRHLPDGTFVEDGRGPLLVAGGALHRWTWHGYQPETGTVEPCGLLTPPATVAAFAAGYRPLLHPSVERITPESNWH
jgi:hypothetical protein